MAPLCLQLHGKLNYMIVLCLKTQVSDNLSIILYLIICILFP